METVVRNEFCETFSMLFPLKTTRRLGLEHVGSTLVYGGLQHIQEDTKMIKITKTRKENFVFIAVPQIELLFIQVKMFVTACLDFQSSWKDCSIKRVQCKIRLYRNRDVLILRKGCLSC